MFPVFVVLLVASSIALATNETVSGIIQNIDFQKGQIVLKSTAGRIIELQAPAELVAGLEAGEAVQVKIFVQKAPLSAEQTDEQLPPRAGAMTLHRSYSR